MTADAGARMLDSTKEAEMHGSTDEWMQFLNAGGTGVGFVLLMLVVTAMLVSGAGALSMLPRP
jgi:hypothetical protein